MPVKKNKTNKDSFEVSLSRLERIVSDMESEELKLDESLKKFEEGISLVRFCSKKLDDAQNKIEVLMRDKNGGLFTKPFEEYENDPS